MAFKDNTLTFSDTKIVEDSTDIEVMMSWEAPIMEKSSKYICQSNGDILEIGFGMGICADYIQAEGVNSHTIIEIHPQIIQRLNIWASDKSNVTVVEGDWSSANLSTYDGIFLDTYGDDSLDSFKVFAIEKAKDGAKITYWNNEEREYNPYLFESVEYEKISVNPDVNFYTSIKDYYYMPKVVK
jgi:hypothetical protein